MKIISETSLSNFNAWSGGEDTLNRVINKGKCDLLESILEDIYPDGMTDTELNDLLRFDSESVYEWLDIRSESVIREELEEAKEELEDLNEELNDIISDYDDECIGIADWERKELWEETYKDDHDNLKNQIAEQEEKITELEEELENI